MKNLVVSAFLIALFTHCKKKYTCTCTYQGRVISTGSGKMTRKKADENCKKLQNSDSWVVSPVECVVSE